MAETEILKKQNGGARPGAGKKKGYRHKHTLDKIMAREHLRLQVTARQQDMVNAQIQNALGLKHLFMRDDAGKWTQVTDPDMIEVVLNSGEEGKYFYIHSKDPSIQAFTDLMNRALDKPKEQEQEVTIKLTTELKEMPGDRLAAELEALRGKLQASKALAREPEEA